MTDNTRNQKASPIANILVALIGAFGAIAVAYISSDRFVDGAISELEVQEERALEEQPSNQRIVAESSGTVFVVAAADPTHRLVRAVGSINDREVAIAIAQDATDPRVPSISQTSFQMPVDEGDSWQVTTAGGNEELVTVLWSGTRFRLVRQQ